MQRSCRAVIIASLLSWTSSLAAADRGVLIAAAISLKPALDEINAELAAEQKLGPLTFTFASSGALQQQIEQGAPVDIFIAAGEEPMQKLKQKGLIHDASLVNFLRNSLLVAVPLGKGAAIKDLSELKQASFKKIAMGDPKTVPAGQYAKDSLDKLNLSEALQAKIVYGNNVKQVLTYIETANADAGFVYATDAKASRKVSIAFAVPADLHRPIVYPAALVKNSKLQIKAEAILKELQSEKSQAIFRKHGFLSSDKPTG